MRFSKISQQSSLRCELGEYDRLGNSPPRSFEIALLYALVKLLGFIGMLLWNLRLWLKRQVLYDAMSIMASWMMSYNFYSLCSAFLLRASF